MESPIEKTNKSRWKLLLDWIKRHVLEIISFVLLCMGLFFFAYHRNYDSSLQIDGELWGQFGDYVGGIVGTLLMYFSINLLNKNFREQVKANEELRKSNENSIQISSLQQFDSTFSTLMELYKQAQNEIEGLSKEWSQSFTSKQNEYDKRIDDARQTFYKHYTDNRAKLAPYFRLLYRMMQTIDESDIKEDTKRRYAKIFRCQLSEEELLLIRYNASTHYGKKMQVYINRYNLLKHLPKFHLLEFKEPSILVIIKDKEEFYDQIFIELRKRIKNRLSNIVDSSEFSPNEKREKLQVDSDEFEIFLCVSRSSVRVELEYILSANKKTTSLENSLLRLLNYFVFETFVFASYEQYQKLDDLLVKSDVRKETKSRKHTIWIEIQRKDGYDLVLSQKQLTEPSPSSSGLPNVK